MWKWTGVLPVFISLLISCFHKWLLPASPSHFSVISLLDSVRGYWMGVSDGEKRRRVGTFDRHGWAVSVVMATRKCIYHSVDELEVNADHSPSFFTPCHPLFTLILICVIDCLTFFTVSLSSSVIFSLILFFPLMFPVLSCCKKQVSDLEKLTCLKGILRSTILVKAQLECLQRFLQREQINVIRSFFIIL